MGESLDMHCLSVWERLVAVAVNLKSNIRGQCCFHTYSVEQREIVIDDNNIFKTGQYVFYMRLEVLIDNS